MDKLMKNKTAIVIFVAPAIILFTFVLLVPICVAVYYSLCEYIPASRSYSFIGMKNFTDLAKDPIMKTALKNSLFFLAFSCISQLIMGVLLAGLLTNIKWGRNLFKNVIYLPCVLSSAALGLLWVFIFNEKTGINKVMKNMGVTGPHWMSDINGFIILPMWVIAFVALWQYVGQSMMLYMAQISGINKSLYEAAAIDGCTKPKAFRYITLPLIKPMVGTAMSLNAIGSLKFFDLIYTMTDENCLNHELDVLATHLYRQGFKFSKYGYASAIGVVLVILCLIATGVIKVLFRSEDYEM